jgi:predicted dehydrogenase
MSLKTRLGLIGAGRRMANVIDRIIAADENVEVKAVCDPNPHSVATVKAKLNPDVAVYEDYRELVRAPDIDWVMIGSWNCFHARQTIAAFQAGKHVFCEKPLALTIADCVAMREAWQASGQQFTIGFTLRYSPHYRRIREIVAEGRLGRIISMEFNETLEFNHGGYIHADWRRKTEWAGSHLLEKCCHDVDLINWMTGATCLRAASFGGRDFFTAANRAQIERIGKSPDGKDAFTTWSDARLRGNIINPFNDDKDILDNQVAILEFDSGVRATFHTNCCTAIPERRMLICGTEGTLRSDVVSGVLEMQRIGFDTVRENCPTGVSGGHGGGDKVLAESLVDSMRNGAAPLTSLEDGLRAAVTVFGIDEAQRSGAVVDLRPLWQAAGIAVS